MRGGDREGGDAIQRDLKSFCKRGPAIARPPSVTDQHVGSPSLCSYAGSWMGVGVSAREMEEKFCPQSLSWACAVSYKKTGNKE